jgi:hypothetical protein
MSEELELDAPVLDNEVENTQDEPIEVEGAEDRPEDESTDLSETAEPEGDGRRLPQWIKDLKTGSPEAYKQAKGAFFGKQAIDDKLKDFDLDGIKGWLEEKGGRESLETAFAEMEAKSVELDGINEALATGNTSIITEIADLHPESFGKLAEATLNEWSRRNPDDYARVISGVFASTFRDSNIDSHLQTAALYLEVGRTEQALKILNDVRQWTNSFGQAAQQAPRNVQTQAARNDGASQQIANERQQMYNEKYQGKLSEQRKPMIEDGLKDYFAMRPDSTGTRERALAAAVQEIESTLGKDQQFVRSVSAFHSKGDADGALRLIKSREARVMSDISKKVGEDFYGKLAAKVVKPAAKSPVSITRKAPPIAKPLDRFAEIFNRA